MTRLMVAADPNPRKLRSIPSPPPAPISAQDHINFNMANLGRPSYWSDLINDYVHYPISFTNKD
ncbi:hypothetical protein Prudu_015192 [Prunus dulcis]|uniref:Uncharacterized protein n=1 Tax=Prunus dulcis TaxID=3755 RepID=A0A4Y1RIJ6_PRUDU|nr:hypothetical protein Prudu_015192 [Prunus dulcis]